MNIVVRVEGNSTIGMGHISRCMVLASQLADSGAKIHFLATKQTCHTIKQRLPEQSGYGFYILPDDLTEAEDASCSLPFLDSADLLVADHYLLGKDWETIIRPFVKQLMVIDDLGREHNCDILLDQNYFENPAVRYAGKLTADCHTLFGPSYALLRPTIATARNQSNVTLDDHPCRIFICFGGSDSHNTTHMVMKAMAMLPELSLTADIVISSLHPQKTQLEQYSAQFPKWRLITDHPAPELLMAQADIAIGAGGVMTWERCAVGLPSIVITIADNQKEVTSAMAKKELLLYAGHYDQMDVETIKRLILSLWSDSNARARMAAGGMALVDGLGAMRVAKIISR